MAGSTSTCEDGVSWTSGERPVRNLAPDMSNTVNPGCHERAEAHADAQSEKEADAVWSAMRRVTTLVAPVFVMTAV